MSFPVSYFVVKNNGFESSLGLCLAANRDNGANRNKKVGETGRSVQLWASIFNKVSEVYFIILSVY